MSLSDEIKAAIGGDGKSRHQTRCLYEQWAARAKELEAELEQCLDCCKRVGELEAQNDDTLTKLLERERLNIVLQKENEKLREHIELLEEDIRCYQADL